METQRKTGDAFRFLYKITKRATRDTQTKKATENELIILQNILTACSQLKYTRDQNFEEHFFKETGVNPNEIKDMCEHDAQKLIAYASCLLHEVFRYTLDHIEFNALESK